MKNYIQTPQRLDRRGKCVVLMGTRESYRKKQKPKDDRKREEREDFIKRFQRSTSLPTWVTVASIEKNWGGNMSPVGGRKTGLSLW